MLVDEEDDEETLDEISDESHSSEIEALQKVRKISWILLM